MALIGELQARNFFLVNTATESTLSDVRAGANLNGAIVQDDGTAAAANSDFMLAMVNNKGELTISDKINPANVTYANAIAYSAPVARNFVISAITADANTLYTVSIILSGFGSLSVENEYVKKGFYKAKTGDDAENIVDGLVKSLAKSIAREQPSSPDTFSYTDADSNTLNLPDNYFFSFTKTGTGASATLTIAEKSDWRDKYYVTGKKTNLEIDFHVDADFETDPTIVETVGSQGAGTGYQVRNLEEYLLGNRADTFRGAGYPHNFEENYDSSLSGTYSIIELAYFDVSRDEPMESKKQITIACPSTTVADALITDLNTALTGTGISIGTLS